MDQKTQDTLTSLIVRSKICGARRLAQYLESLQRDGVFVAWGRKLTDQDLRNISRWVREYELKGWDLDDD